MSTFKIYPIYLGNAYEDISFVIGKTLPGKPWELSLGCILLQNDQTGEWTLLDTGFAPKSEVIENHLPHTYILEMKDPYPLTLQQGLATVGIKPEDIHQIGLSHLHQDHAWNLELFGQDVPIHVQQKELAHAISCRNVEKKSYGMYPMDKPGYPHWIRGKDHFVMHDGDYEIEPGLRALFTPGHTPGSQSFLIDTKEGPYIYVGDLYYTEQNWQEPGGHILGWFNSMEDWYHSHDKVMNTRAKILSVHCPSTFSQKCYG